MKPRATTLAVVLAAALAVPVFAHDTRAHRYGGERYAASEVRRVQDRLNGLGYQVGTVDGVMGPKTHTALRNFQRDKGLNATGELDQDTFAALDLGRGSPTAGRSR